ncbi:MAG: BolA/IbaG family iron-sulfur metabolism protein [Sedimenticolaceae bacterium]
MEAQDIKQRILGAYPDARIETDGADCNFSVTIVSTAFHGKNPIQRQRPVLALFKDDISSGALHALSITAKTPEEMDKR